MSFRSTRFIFILLLGLCAIPAFFAPLKLAHAQDEAASSVGFKAQPRKKSASKELYIFKHTRDGRVSKGDFLTLTESGKPVATIKVIKAIPKRFLFIARVVKYFEAYNALTLRKIYIATIPVQDNYESLAETQPLTKTGFDFIATLGVGSLSYQESPLVPASRTTSIDIGVGYNYRITPNFRMWGEISFTALPVGGLEGAKIRTLASEGAFAYGLNLGESAKLEFLLGAFYRSFLVSGGFEGNAFGVQNLFGPQLYPRLVFQISTNGTIFLYGRYSPVLDGLKLLSKSSEVSGAIGYTQGFDSGFALSFALKYSALKLTYPVADAELAVSANRVGLDIGFIF